MTWGIPVRDPQTRDEARERAKALRLKFWHVPVLAPAPVPAGLALAEAQRRVEEAERELRRAEQMISDWLDKTRRDEFRIMQRPMACELPAGVYMRRIVAWVACRHGLHINDLLGPRRTRDVSRPRQLAMQMICHSKFCKALSLPQVARYFNRDHTTVLHALEKAPSYRARRPKGDNAYYRRMSQASEERRQRLGLDESA